MSIDARKFERHLRTMSRDQLEAEVAQVVKGAKSADEAMGRLRDHFPDSLTHASERPFNIFGVIILPYPGAVNHDLNVPR